jgi:hypothetical protein
VVVELGAQLILAGATGQEKKKDGKWPPSGRVEIYTIQSAIS